MGLTVDTIVRTLGLQRNPEGGFFRQTYTAPVANKSDRPHVTVIYYLITSQEPIGYLHRMSAESIHFFHLGSPLKVYLVDPAGSLHVSIMGPDLLGGQQLQCTVRGQVWKAFELVAGEYALISEAVAPGWIPSDQESAVPDLVSKQFPHLSGQIERFIKSNAGGPGPKKGTGPFK